MRVLKNAESIVKQKLPYVLNICRLGNELHYQKTSLSIFILKKAIYMHAFEQNIMMFVIRMKSGIELKFRSVEKDA